MSKPILGYWNYRGLGNPIRFLCAYVGVDYEEKTYVMGGPPDFSWEPWLESKFTLGLDFPNVPYWIEGDLKLTQVKAILKHIARTRAPELLPSDPKIQTQADVIDTVVLDNIFMPLAILCYNYSEQGLETYKQSYQRLWTEFSEYLGSKKWILGDDLSYLDFLTHAALFHCKTYNPTAFAAFPNFEDYLKRFESLPAIKAHLNSNKYVAGPCYSYRGKQPGKIQF